VPTRKTTRTYSRRAVTKKLGSIAGGAVLFAPAIASALARTPTQTEGPFYPPAPHDETDVDLTLLDGHAERAAGETILVRGRVTDLSGKPLANARVDIWQANHWGRYAHPGDRNPAPLDPNFQGIGITHTDAEGRYGFRTIRPAPYPLSAMGDSGMRPRHIHFKVEHETAGKVTTQMYFEGDPLIWLCPIVNAIPRREAIESLIAKLDMDAAQPMDMLAWRFDITLRGREQTLFENRQEGL